MLLITGASDYNAVRKQHIWAILTSLGMTRPDQACAVVRVVGSILERFEKQGFQADLSDGCFQGFWVSMGFGLLGN